MFTCQLCKKEIPKERVELGFNKCIQCSDQGVYLGAPQISGKTGNDINLVKSTDKNVHNAFNLGGCIIRRATPKYVIKQTKNRKGRKDV